MKKFEDLQHEDHHWGGTQAKMFFPNGYGVSVIRAGSGGFMSGSYGAEDGLYELAVIKGSAENWKITYSTDITDDVVGSLTESDVSDIMVKVQELPTD